MAGFVSHYILSKDENLHWASLTSYRILLKIKTQTIYGGLHARRDVTAADQLGNHSVELAQLSVLVLDWGAGTLVQSDQHESGRDIQLQQLGLLCQACGVEESSINIKINVWYLIHPITISFHPLPIVFGLSKECQPVFLHSNAENKTLMFLIQFPKEQMYVTAE